jgi:large subunit ribosomal protein L16
MLIPKKTKHRKPHKGRRRFKGTATSGFMISFGQYGLQSMDNKWITSRQIEAARRAMTRYVQRGGKIWIRIFPHQPVTKKGDEVPMGKGKGTVDHYVQEVKPGTIIFEMDGIDEKTAREAMRLAAHKLPVRTKFITRN